MYFWPVLYQINGKWGSRSFAVSPSNFTSLTLMKIDHIIPHHNINHWMHYGKFLAKVLTETVPILLTAINNFGIRDGDNDSARRSSSPDGIFSRLGASEICNRGLL